MSQSTKIEGLTPYQDFIVSVIKLEKEIKKEHKGEARFADFKLVDLLYKYREENAEINKRVLSLITKYGADEKSLEPLVEEIKRERKNRIDDKIKLREKEKDAVALIENYMLRYYNKYFRVIGGNVVKTDLMLYDYEDQDVYSKKLARSADNSLPIILMPDGEAFFSATCHQDIASWLNASGKSLQGAVRIFISQKNHHFTMSEMHDYDYVDSTKNDEDLLLRDEQVRAIAVMFKDAKSRWSKINNPYKMVLYSRLCGGEERANRTENQKKNLHMIAKEFGEELFDEYEYNSYLRNQKLNQDWQDEWLV